MSVLTHVLVRTLDHHDQVTRQSPIGGGNEDYSRGGIVLSSQDVPVFVLVLLLVYILVGGLCVMTVWSSDRWVREGHSLTMAVAILTWPVVLLVRFLVRITSSIMMTVKIQRQDER